MEDVLEVYHRLHDPAFPVICLDETSKQLVAETRVPIAAKPGRPARHDYEYRRNGTANLFMLFAPLVLLSRKHPGAAANFVWRDASVIGYRWRFKPSGEGWDGS
jgi:hypothetical protein